MNKRGQMFLAAAFIIVAALAGLGAITNSINVPKQDLRIQKLAEEIKYENLEIINNAILNGKNFTVMNSTINNLTGSYANLNQEMMVFTWLKTKDGNIDQAFYQNGKMTIKPLTITVDYSSGTEVIIKDLTRNIYYNLSTIDKSNNFYVLVIKEDKNGRIVAME